MGSTGATVVASDGNAAPGTVTHYRWTWIDVPSLSAFPLGLITEGPVSNISFVPDVEGDYHLMVEAFGVTGFKTIDRRVFRVELASTRALPAFDAEADALNFGGQSRGWKPDMEAWLLYLEALVSPGMSSAGAQSTVQVAGATPGTFAAATNVFAGNTWVAFGSGTLPSSGYVRFQSTTGALITGRNASGDAIILRQSGDQIQLADDSLWHLYAGARSIIMWSRYADGELYGGSVAATQMLTWNGNGVQIGGTPQFGGGTYVLGLRAASVNPSTNPTNAVAFYCDSSDDYAVKYRKPSGQIVPLDAMTNPATNGFRLSAATGTPIPTADVTSTNTIYLTPHKSNVIALFTNNRWVTRSTAEVTLALSGLTTGKNYDVFAYWSGSAVLLELSAAWTTDTVRADTLVRQDGVWVKQTDTTRRYIGTFRAISASTTADRQLQRFVWNIDNQVERTLYVTETVLSWTLSFTSYGIARGNAANCFEWVTGFDEKVEIECQAIYRAAAAGWGCQVGIGLDTTSSSIGMLHGMLTNRDDVHGFGYGYTRSSFRGRIAQGYHKANWLERQGGTTILIYSVVQADGPGVNWGASGMLGYVVG